MIFDHLIKKKNRTILSETDLLHSILYLHLYYHPLSWGKNGDHDLSLMRKQDGQTLINLILLFDI